jgi:hypothetical protein
MLAMAFMLSLMGCYTTNPVDLQEYRSQADFQKWRSLEYLSADFELYWTLLPQTLVSLPTG